MQLFSSDATIYFFLSKIFFAHKKTALKRPLWQFGFFFSAAPTAQNSLELKIHVRDVAQDTAVFYSVFGGSVCYA
jgi:hypothetical protein